MKRCLVLIAIVFMAFSAEADQSLINKKAPEFSLLDQYDRSFTLQSFSGHPMILLACDKKGSELNGPWKTAIIVRYAGRVPCLGVADLRTVMFFMTGIVKRHFKKEPASVLLDWDGELFTAYGLAQNVPNIILIDANGFVRHMYSGSASSEAIGQLFNAVDDIKKKVP